MILASETFYIVLPKIKVIATERNRGQIILLEKSERMERWVSERIMMGGQVEAGIWEICYPAWKQNWGGANIETSARGCKKWNGPESEWG